MKRKIDERLIANKSKICVILLFIILTLTFTVSFKTKFKVHYDKFYGFFSFCSGSTIKFVNNWLIETPQKLHFLNIELPDSIEFNELAEREPYISYPSGCTFFVYIFAKILGRQTIDISFLKHFQMICYWFETLLFAFFVYRFLKNNGIKSELEITVAAFLTAIIWAWIPINVWYLANVYFADECITLFVLAFLLVEYESYCCQNKGTAIILNSIKALLIFAGVLIDYYFWILTFVAFVLSIIYSIKSKKTLVDIIKNSLWYVVPVILGVAVFICQLISVPNWQSMLLYQLLFRTGVSNSEFDAKIPNRLYSYFVDGFGLKTNLSAVVLLLLILCFHSESLIKIKNNCTILRKSILTKNGIVILLGIIAPIFQIIFLRNHSAMHPFSQIKIAWIFAIFPVVFSVIYYKTIDIENQKSLLEKTNDYPFLKCFIASFLCVVFITGVPFSSMEFQKREDHELYDLTLAKILRDNTSYEHVCFSFTYNLPTNPPQELAVSRKKVYKIDNKTELNTMFPNLNEQAIKIFVIDKDAASELTDEQAVVQNELRNSNKVFFENERFCLLELSE